LKQSYDGIEPYALAPGTGWTYNLGIDFTIKHSETRAGSGAAVVEYTTRAGEEPSDHTHPTEDEMFYVLAGNVTFRCGGKSFPLGAGGFVFLPCGVEHGYTTASGSDVRLLVVTCPVRAGMSGGWGGFVADMESGQGELVRTPNDSI